MALAGGLVRAGWLKTRWNVHRGRRNRRPRRRGVRTGEKDNPSGPEAGRGQERHGLAKLTKLLGEKGDAVVRKVRDWLELL